MLRKFDYSWLLLKRSLWLILPIAGIGMAESRLNLQRCNNLVIEIKNDSGARFLNQMDVRMLLTENGSDPLLGSKLSDVALHDLEKRVTRNRLIRKCQVFRDLRGNIVVEVEQEKPLARWINASENGELRNTSGYYINYEGNIFPLSESYSARALLVSGSFFNDSKKMQTATGSSVMELLRFLNTDPFWKAQVAQLNADKDGEISLMTVLGDQKIEFGMADDYQAKFEKLRLFYDKVLSRDWSRYKRISVKFQDQIVCE
ncbi:cell division protein FtsQ/DivIB [Dyadobacter sp. CY323]|uniref:cell division protein FtsQ/DivIB n=1 Tax=Dyadobacter sp. CY323 TaxID=2907302 RepID=UPI001F3C226B|nr:cell division protein FtsQ/DivIB [Dyadobacter sp. CY323]MCE6988795.1 cell division protein FtsQ/DivIB [Dyadobacter sp. CY323]